ncbi:MAG: carboxyl transferase domain-containing protein [Usitatibacter sp.]
MSASPAAPILDALRSAIAFSPVGESAGNLSIGRGTLDGRLVHAALVENRGSSGALGALECARLAALFRIVTVQRAPLVLFLDSAGAKVSEGLRALGAFRTLYRAGLEAALAGAPIAVVLGKYCYGGASMLAHLGDRRLFSEATQLAMSGPSIIASAAGMNALDEAFRAMAEAALSPAARAKANAANSLWVPGSDLAAWLRDALAAKANPLAALRLRHDELGARLAERAPPAAAEPLHRRDLERIYAEGYEGEESQGFFTGRGRHGGAEEDFIGIAGKAPLGAARAWQFADAAWKLRDAKPRHLEVFLDCAAHAARLEDERIVLTEYIVDMAFALAACGTRAGLTVLGKAGGGVYVALAAPAARVASVHGADIQVLPGAAVAAILGESREEKPAFSDYRAAGVADEELKLGLIP